MYIIKDIDVTGYYKIGYTNNLTRRLYDFVVKLPFQIMTVMLFQCDYAHDLEMKLHRIYNAKRIRGEWFKLTELDITFIKAMIEYCDFCQKLTPENWEYIDIHLASKLEVGKTTVAEVLKDLKSRG